MPFAVIIRRHFGCQSYLVLDHHPRELLRHPGFDQEFSVRPWLGSVDPVEALEEWAEMLAEDQENYLITDQDNWQYAQDRHLWDVC